MVFVKDAEYPEIFDKELLDKWMPTQYTHLKQVKEVVYAMEEENNQPDNALKNASIPSKKDAKGSPGTSKKRLRSINSVILRKYLQAQRTLDQPQ